MAALTPQTPAVIGTTLTPITPTVTTGDTVPIGSRLIVRNGSGGAINVTIVTPGNDQYGNARPDIVFTGLANGATAMFGPFPTDLGDPSTNVVTVICSVVTSVQLYPITS